MSHYYFIEFLVILIITFILVILRIIYDYYNYKKQQSYRKEYKNNIHKEMLISLTSCNKIILRRLGENKMAFFNHQIQNLEYISFEFMFSLLQEFCIKRYVLIYDIIMNFDITTYIIKIILNSMNITRVYYNLGNRNIDELKNHKEYEWMFDKSTEFEWMKEYFGVK